MNSRKRMSFLLAFTLLIISTCLYVPRLKAAATYGNLIVNDFETGLDGWGPRGTDAEVVSLSTEHRRPYS